MEPTPPIADPGGDGWRAELGATLRLSWPLAAANLLQMLTYAIDVIFIARLGEDQLAASALAIALFGLVLWALSGLTGAVAPVAAAELGERAPALRPVRRSVRMALWLAVFSGVAGIGICLLLGPLMHVTGQQAQITALAIEYNSLLVLSLVPMLFNNVLRSFVSTLDRPIFATAITAGGIFVNALANYAFIFGNLGAPELGLQGAAVATILTTLTTLAAYVVAIRLDPKLHRYRVFGRWWSPDWPRLLHIVRIGTPIALTITAEAGIFGAAAFLMGNIGASQLAAHTVALQIAALAFQVPFGVGQAATIRVGYFYGARDPDGMKRAGWTAIVVGTGFMAFTALLMIVIPKPLIAIYVDPWDPKNAVLVGFALQYIVIAAAFQLFDGMQAVAAGALRGLQDTRIPMWIAAFAYWVPGIGTALALGFYTPLEGVGVWIGLATGLTVAAALLGWRWHRREALGLTRREAKA
ncbi:MATE family efflux transporter [Qipengyuania flava]|uniref:MATE family efflux transporter n=1 Tax=Qipengyuania flava TaxID=192812 RepID=UPI001C568FE1|nr:MATE family efflux transporter [Qipengyuania flava]MBW3169637.1 MATE family efflux transporter [Qipengyuania flava]MBY5966875.1 MATE family efflux transporter [Qipengyuania flava]MBY6013199.1 MATE family efflux transporter [Qipengyuania flava]MBY6027641.1 MATE family efflux transporter [Qipengyuania flava]